MNHLFKISALSSALFLAACGGGSGGSVNNVAGYGELSLGLTDGPVENANAVVVAFTSVEVHGEESKTIEFDTVQTIDLLSYQNGESVLLLDEEVFEAGEYQWIRLGIDESQSYIEIEETIGDVQYPLEIPSGAQTGLKLNRGFTIAVDGHANFTIDFDLRKSVHQEGTGDYKLRPTLRIVDNLQAGTISGTVADTLITDENCNNGDNDDIGNAVYLFSGHDAVIQDVQGNAGDPVASATVTYNGNTSEYEFTVGFVEAGNYTIAFTCDASIDDSTPGADDSASMSFTLGQNVSVTADNDTSVDFN